MKNLYISYFFNLEMPGLKQIPYKLFNNKYIMIFKKSNLQKKNTYRLFLIPLI